MAGLRTDRIASPAGSGLHPRIQDYNVYIIAYIGDFYEYFC
jgi:hypothetical protein